jgi:hypothetical protein
MTEFKKIPEFKVGDEVYLENYNKVCFNNGEVHNFMIDMPLNKPFKIKLICANNSPYFGGVSFETLGGWYVPTNMKLWSEHPSQNKSKEELLLEEAKLKYPVGTKFRVVHQSGNIYTVKSHEKHINTFVKERSSLHINFIVVEISDSDTNSASVYANGEWAKIITEEKPEEKPMENKENIKKGSWVVVKQLISQDTLGKKNFKLNELFKVREIQPSSIDYIETWIRNENNKEISIKNLRLATEQEIKDYLVKESKNKGFNNEVQYIGVRDNNIGEQYDHLGNSIKYQNPKDKGKVSDGYWYNIKTDTLYNWGAGLFILYEKGVWATLKSETVTPPVPETPKLSFKEDDWLYYDDGSMVGVFKLQISTIKDSYGAKIGFFKSESDIIHYYENCNNYTSSTSNYVKRLATKEEVSHYLLQEAKKRYPIGTKFNPAHVLSDNDPAIIEVLGDYYLNGNQIEIKPKYIKKSKNLGKSAPLLYHNGTWAKIVSEPNKTHIHPNDQGYDLVSKLLTKVPLPDKSLFYDKVIDCVNLHNFNKIQEFLIKLGFYTSNGIPIKTSYHPDYILHIPKIKDDSLSFSNKNWIKKENISLTNVSFFKQWILDLEEESFDLQQVFTNSLINTNQTNENQNKQTNEKESNNFRNTINSSESEKINFDKIRKTATIFSGPGLSQESVSGRKRRVSFEGYNSKH